MQKLDISVIILTKNEEIHIRRCLDNIKEIAKDIFIIDSFSTDRTLDIAREYPQIQILQNKWENKYAKQLNWGLEHAPIKTKWVMRLDADEYLSKDLIQEIKDKLNALPEDITGINFKRCHVFLGKQMRHGGTYPTVLLRLFRYGIGTCEERLMDEHIQLSKGKTITFDSDFFDHNLNNFSWWAQKHIGYAIREATDLLDIELDLTGSAKDDNDRNMNSQAADKRSKKHKYVKMKLFWRSFVYFLFRYIVKGGYLDGKEGFCWCFMQGWWYRTMVDIKVLEIKRTCGTDKEKIKKLLKAQYNIEI